MTYIDKLFNDFGFYAAMNRAVTYCKVHNIKYGYTSKGDYAFFSWLDPDDNEIHIKIS